MRQTAWGTFYSVCEVDHRWFWGAWYGCGMLLELSRPPFLSGTAEARAEAEDLGLASAGPLSLREADRAFLDFIDHNLKHRPLISRKGPLCAVWPDLLSFLEGHRPLLSLSGPPPSLSPASAPHLGQGHYLDLYLRRLSAEKRMARNPSRSSMFDPIEYLYVIYHDHGPLPHRIDKKTTRWVYVERIPFSSRRLTGTWRDFVVETVRLDRIALERTGKVWSQSFEGLFCLPEHPEVTGWARGREKQIYDPAQEEASRTLGLTSWPCSAEELKKAFRAEAKKRHSDTGGSDRAFRDLHEAYALLLGFAV